MRRKKLFVLIGAVCADERPERDVAVGGPIPLTVDAKGIVPIILNLTLKEVACVWCLRISIHLSSERRMSSHEDCFSVTRICC